MASTYYIVGHERLNDDDIVRIINRMSYIMTGYDLFYPTPKAAIEANEEAGAKNAAELPLIAVTFEKTERTQ